jgi:hypothetical protein
MQKLPVQNTFLEDKKILPSYKVWLLCLQNLATKNILNQFNSIYVFTLHIYSIKFNFILAHILSHLN